MNTPEVPPNNAADFIEDDDEVKFYDSTYCEAEAIETVDVSKERAGDETRNYCGACLEAYYVGVQHGRIRTEAEQSARGPGNAPTM